MIISNSPSDSRLKGPPWDLQWYLQHLFYQIRQPSQVLRLGLDVHWNCHSQVCSSQWFKSILHRKCLQGLCPSQHLWKCLSFWLCVGESLCTGQTNRRTSCQLQNVTTQQEEAMRSRHAPTTPIGSRRKESFSITPKCHQISRPWRSAEGLDHEMLCSALWSSLLKGSSLQLVVTSFNFLFKEFGWSYSIFLFSSQHTCEKYAFHLIILSKEEEANPNRIHLHYCNIDLLLLL